MLRMCSKLNNNKNVKKKKKRKEKNVFKIVLEAGFKLPDGGASHLYSYTNSVNPLNDQLCGSAKRVYFSPELKVELVI